MAQRSLAEGHERELHARRVALGLVRHVRAGDVGRRADGGEEVVDERPVEHLLGGDGEHHRAPPLDASRGARQASVSSGAVFRLNAAYRYSHINPCSSSAASQSRYVSVLRFSMTMGGSAAMAAESYSHPRLFGRCENVGVKFPLQFDRWVFT